MAVIDNELARLRSLIDRADVAYYRTGKAIITDQAYDAQKQLLRALDPDDERLTRVGPPYDAEDIGTKAQHAMPMGSLDNVDNGILGVADWYEDMYQKLKLTNGMTTMLSLKVDGSSIELKYESGVFVQAITRGNGIEGEDVTANVAMFQGVPTVLPWPITCSIRGEAVLHKSDFQVITAGTPPEQLGNPRNEGNGIVVRHDGTQSELIRFYAFNMVQSKPAGSEYEKFQDLQQLGFTVVPHKLAVSPAEIEEYYHNALANRVGLDFEIDGLVMVLNLVQHQQKFITADPKTILRPKYARAIKFPSYFAFTKVTGVVVTVGHNRAVVPTLDVERVRCGGVFVDSVIVTNYDEIRRQQVAIGDEVEVFLAGDIIPNLARVVKQAPDRRPILEPTSCPACGCPTSRESRGREGANLYCTNLECDAALIRKIGHWCGTSKKGIGIMDIGDTMIQALWDCDLIRDPAGLYTLTPAQIEDVTTEKGVRIGVSRADTIVANIQAKKVLPLHLFLGGLGIDLLGTRRVQLLAAAAGGQLDTLEQWLDDANLATLEITGMTGANSITRQAIRDGIDRCRPLIQKLLAVGVVAVPIAAAPTPANGESATEGTEKPFAGKSFCFTGTRECLAQVEALGGTINDSMRKGTTYLIYKPAKDGHVTNKAAKAEQLGTQVVPLDLLKLVLAGQAQLPE